MNIPLPSRPFESPMTLAIRNSRVTVAPDTPALVAGADVLPADPPERVAAVAAVVDAQRDATYRDVVAAEHVRQSRLSRWQEQR